MELKFWCCSIVIWEKTRAGDKRGKRRQKIIKAKNSSIPKFVLMLNEAYNDAIVDPALSASGGGCGVRGSILNGFESTHVLLFRFRWCPCLESEPLERGGFFLSGPIERRTLSGLLDVNVDGGGGVDADASGLRRRIVL